nr:helix-turn-helix transcriptional regulator [Roseibium litorale]
MSIVARELGMSLRVLQRRLSETGHKFQELHDDIRRVLASDLLRVTALPVSEISYRLGFSAIGNFTRAARRWFGMPPREWRWAGAMKGQRKAS